MISGISVDWSGKRAPGTEINIVRDLILVRLIKKLTHVFSTSVRRSGNKEFQFNCVLLLAKTT